MESPQRPLVAVLGGAKVSDKIAVIQRFVKVADKIIIGGAMANTFLDYKGISVGASKVEEGQRDVLDSIYATARDKVGDDVDDFIILPVDLAVAPSLSIESQRRVVKVGSLETDAIARDIGDVSITRVAKEYNKALSVG